MFLTDVWLKGRNMGYGWGGWAVSLKPKLIRQKEALRTGCQKLWQMLCLIAFFLISVGAPLCNGDVEDTDSRSVDMESIPEQKGQ